MIRLLSKFFGIFLLMFGVNTAQAAYFVLPDWTRRFEITAYLGYEYLHSDHSHIVITPYETDSLKRKSAHPDWAWKLGISTSIFDYYLNEYYYFNKLYIELNYSQAHGEVKGHVWQYGFSQFNNYNFKVPVFSQYLMLDAKLVLFDYEDFAPYGVLGIGVASSRAGYREKVTGVGVPPDSYISLAQNHNTHTAYEVGLGMARLLNEEVTLSLEYLHMWTGRKVVPSGKNATIVPVMHAPRFKLTTDTLMLGVSFKC